MKKYVQGGKIIETRLLIFQLIPPHATSKMGKNQYSVILITLRRKMDYQNLEKYLITEWFLFYHFGMIIK
jgi:hypothetical protein